MIHPSITLYELANLRYAELLREAAEYRRHNIPAPSRGPRRSWLPGIFDAITAALHGQQNASAAQWSQATD